MPLPRSLQSRRRIEMKLAGAGLPEIPLLGRYNHSRAEHPLSDHGHGEILEICFLLKGRQTYRVCGEDHRLNGGDVFIAFPHETHSTAGMPQEKGTLYWVMIRQTDAPFLGLPPAQARALWHALCHLPSRRFRGSAGMKEHFDTITGLYQDKDFPLREVSLRVEALSLLLEIIRCSERQNREENPARRLKPVFAFIESHLDEPVSVPQLAREARLSTARLKALFKEETGLPPGEYALRRRVEEARRRLALRQSSVTEVTFEFGFPSSQYFATVFKRFTGITPTAFLKGGKTIRPAEAAAEYENRRDPCAGGA